jgi:hypothetical protein
MYKNQVPVAPEDAGFVADYSLIVSEAAKLRVTLSDSFNSMVFGFLPNNSIVPLVPVQIDNTNQFLAMNKNNIAVGESGQFVIYQNPGWGGNSAINLDTGKQWRAINDSNIAVSSDGYWTQYDPITEWSVPALVEDGVYPIWNSINNNNIAVGFNGAWSIYDEVTHTWSGVDYAPDVTAPLKINDNNIAIETNNGSGAHYLIYNKTTGWTNPLPINSATLLWFFLNNNNLLISDDGFSIRWNGTAWVDLTTLPPLFDEDAGWTALNDNNLAVASNGQVAKYDFITNTWKSQLIQIQSPNQGIFNNNNILFDFEYVDEDERYYTFASQYVEQPPLPTLDYIIAENIVIAKRQLVTAYAARYGADTPYD